VSRHPKGAQVGRHERGTTLVELIVSMSIFSFVMVLTLTALVDVQRDTQRVVSRDDAITQLRQGMAQIDREVRSGNVLYSPVNEVGVTPGCSGSLTQPAGDCMRVYTQSNASQQCVQWQLQEDVSRPGTARLRTRTWSPTWKVDGKVTSFRTVATGLLNRKVDGEWPFRLEATSATSQRVLKLSLLTNPKDTSARAFAIESSISGRNTHYGRDTNICTPVPPVPLAP
jgi:type II secretory pathway component PulJ